MAHAHIQIISECLYLNAWICTHRVNVFVKDTLVDGRSSNVNLTHMRYYNSSLVQWADYCSLIHQSQSPAAGWASQRWKLKCTAEVESGRAETLPHLFFVIYVFTDFLFVILHTTIRLTNVLSIFYVNFSGQRAKTEPGNTKTWDQTKQKQTIATPKTFYKYTHIYFHVVSP